MATVRPATFSKVFRHIHTLRFKLAGLHVLVFGVILAALSVFILNTMESNLEEDFDERLHDVAMAVADRIETARETERQENIDIFVRFAGYYFQSRTDDGRPDKRSLNLGQVHLPWTAEMEAARASASGVPVTIAGEPTAELLGNHGQVRVLTIYRAPDAGAKWRPFYLQVGRSLRWMQTSIDELRRLFLFMVPTALLVALAASWFLASRSLKPIEKIREIAEQLNVQDLSQRFDGPSRGDEVAQMVLTINGMLDRLHASFQAQERFIALASHELKTPLSVLLGELQVMGQRARTPEEYERFARSAQDEVRSLAQTVDSVLTLARAEAGLPMTTSDEVSVNEMVIEAVERCRPLASQREIRLVPQLAMPEGDAAEPTIQGDGELIRLMFVNLIRNAIRVSPPRHPVVIAVAQTKDSVTVSVCDDGPGIAPQYIDRVFDRFFRVPDQDSGFAGVGLGLTIVRGTAELHGGTALARNRPSGGCDFLVHLPLASRNSTRPVVLEG